MCPRLILWHGGSRFPLIVCSHQITSEFVKKVTKSVKDIYSLLPDDLKIILSLFFLSTFQYNT